MSHACWHEESAGQVQPTRHKYGVASYRHIEPIHPVKAGAASTRTAPREDSPSQPDREDDQRAASGSHGPRRAACRKQRQRQSHLHRTNAAPSQSNQFNVSRPSGYRRDEGARDSTWIDELRESKAGQRHHQDGARHQLQRSSAHLRRIPRRRGHSPLVRVRAEAAAHERELKSVVRRHRDCLGFRDDATVRLSADDEIERVIVVRKA